MGKLIAVIVTRNRVDKLARVLSALAAQTRQPDLVLVVDNASEDGTADFLSRQAARNHALRVHRLERNVGGAGGFAQGLRLACDLGADYLWVSDDDAYPDPKAIEALMAALERFEARHERRPTFACSRVVWLDGTHCEMNTPRPVWDWPRFLTPDDPVALVDSCSFVSVLIPRWAIERHGLPIAEYFIWFDDAEFTRRLSQSHPGLYCPESRVTHDIPINRGVNFAFVTAQDLWKFRYGARNEASWRLRREGVVSLIIFADQIRRQMASGRVPIRLRWRVWRSLFEGLFFNPKPTSLPAKANAAGDGPERL